MNIPEQLNKSHVSEIILDEEMFRKLFLPNHERAKFAGF
jgi:hypothetical protein